MLFYFKTNVPVKTLYPYLKRYIHMCSYNYSNNELNDYLENNYTVSLSYVLKQLENNVKINSIDDSLIQIYFDKNKVVKNTKLEDILEFIEYGNLDIKEPKLVSKILNTSIKMLNSTIGGY